MKDAPSDAVQRLLDLAGDVLARSGDGAALQRVARLRDELHVTANRVARFDVDEHPVLDPVRVLAPTAASSQLPPEHLVFQLDLSAGRLMSLLDRLTSRDWARTCHMADRSVTLEALVHRVLDEAANDLKDLLDSDPKPPADVGVLHDGRHEQPRRTMARGARRDAAAW